MKTRVTMAKGTSTSFVSAATRMSSEKSDQNVITISSTVDAGCSRAELIARWILESFFFLVVVATTSSSTTATGAHGSAFGHARNFGGSTLWYGFASDAFVSSVSRSGGWTSTESLKRRPSPLGGDIAKNPV